MILLILQQNGDEVSVFICEGRDGTTAQLDIAKAAVKRLKTLRHPCILTYIDSLEVRCMYVFISVYIFVDLL